MIGRRRSWMLIVLLMSGTSFAQSLPTDRLAAADRLIAVIDAAQPPQHEAMPPFDLADCMDKAVDHPGAPDCNTIAAEQAQAAAVMQARRPEARATMRTVVRNSYATHFATDELDRIAAFYRTPAGAHLLRERSALEAELRAARAHAFAEALVGPAASPAKADAKDEPR